jgi:acetyl-CoA carboxylase biotin carboxylase subunit
MVTELKKILVANRGEIAVRIMRTLKERGITTVAVYSEADREALHVRFADEAYLIGPAPSNESYLIGERIIQVATENGVDGIHPGYGFLSENASFASSVTDAGIIWIGPPSEAITAMGDKITARRIMSEAGVPVVPGTPKAIEDPITALQSAKEIGFPVLIKAAAGGGGKGMRRVDREEQFSEAFEAASREATSSFGRGDCYIEKFLLSPKHVEFQILFDQTGHGVHLFERDCSVQRRHQKVIEETPCPTLDKDTRKKMGAVAIKAGAAVGYVNAGTIEFLLDTDQQFYFLEMNTRLQVEHPITESITGTDLVALQVDIANGKSLPFIQEELTSQGAAIEVRLYAEVPENNFLPSPGTLNRLKLPSGPGIRVDSGVEEGSEVSIYYDPMIAKLIAWGESRDHAISRMKRALGEVYLGGIGCNTQFLRKVLEHPEFASGDYNIGFIDTHIDALLHPVEGDLENKSVAEIAAVLAVHLRDESRKHRISHGEGERSPERTPSRWRLQGRLRQLNKTGRQ